jgi:hypothetical protein
MSLIASGLAVVNDERQAAGRVPHAERGDERWDPDPDDDEPVDQADRCAAEQATDHPERDGKPRFRHQERADHCGEAGVGAHREVELP